MTFTLSGFVNDDDASVVNGSPTLQTTAITLSEPGEYPITLLNAGSLSADNYDFPSDLFEGGTLTVSAVADLNGTKFVFRSFSQTPRPTASLRSKSRKPEAAMEWSTLVRKSPVFVYNKSLATPQGIVDSSFRVIVKGD